MNERVIPLGAGDLALAGVLVLVAGTLSLVLRLGLEKRLALASVRTVVQLLLVGYLLKWVFGLDTPWAVLAIMLVMVSVAAYTSVRRPSRTFSGASSRALLTLVLCSVTTTFVVTGAIIHIEPWYRPQYVVPFLGMILGNSLTGISLCLDQMLDQLSGKRSRIEMELAHGATRWEAARDVLRDSVRKGVIPIINTMMVVGIVSLPGMMTGQILADVDPFEAVKYQIVVMFMIASATSVGCILIALLVYRRLFNSRHQLLSGLIVPQDR